MKLRLRREPQDALGCLGAAGDDAGAQRAVRDRIFGPARVAAPADQVLAARNMLQQGMRVVATRVDEANAYARRGKTRTRTRLVEAHQALTPTQQRRPRKAWK